MTKQKVFFVVFIIIIPSLTIIFSKQLQNGLLFSSDLVKLSFGYIKESLESTIDKHFEQSQTIEKLKHENATLKKEALLYQSYRFKLDSLLNALNPKLKSDTNITLLKSTSYVYFGDLHRIWLDGFVFEPERIYGLMQNNYAIGIAYLKEERAYGVLFGDSDCSFSVYIGKNKVAGIAIGKNDKQMDVKYIPSWIKVNLGERVYTSGLDGIFTPNIPVGKVVSIKKFGEYQRATIDVHANIKNIEYLYLVAQGEDVHISDAQ